MLKKEKKISLHIGGFDHDEEAYHGSEAVADRRKRRIARDQKEAKENPPDISRELRALKRIQRAAPEDIKTPQKKERGRFGGLQPQDRKGQEEDEHSMGMLRDEGLESDRDKVSRSPTKKSIIITNIYTRLKSLDFLLLGQCQQEHEGTCAEAMAEESSEETKRKFKKRKKKSEIQLKNIQSRVEISNFLLRSSDDPTDDKEIEEVDGKTTSRKKKRKEYPYDKQKDGEFGGMNTGEVEWTEPRDTANSRTKRKKENVA